MKRLVSLLLCILLLCLCCVTPVFAAERDNGLVDSGASDFELIGDVDLDGNLTGIDIVYVMRYVVKLHNSAHMYLADVDGDGWVTILDASLMQRFAVGFSPREYGDFCYVYTGPTKSGKIDDVYDCIIAHGNFSYEAIAAFLALHEPTINYDASTGNHDTLSLTHMYFHDPFSEASIDMPHIGEIMRSFTDSGLSLYDCLEYMSDELGVHNRLDYDRRLANYYYNWIYDHEHYPTPMI